MFKFYPIIIWYYWRIKNYINSFSLFNFWTKLLSSLRLELTTPGAPVQCLSIALSLENFIELQRISCFAFVFLIERLVVNINIPKIKPNTWYEPWHLSRYCYGGRLKFFITVLIAFLSKSSIENRWDHYQSLQNFG